MQWFSAPSLAGSILLLGGLVGMLAGLGPIGLAGLFAGAALLLAAWEGDRS